MNGKRKGPKRRARGRKGRREEVRKEKEAISGISWNKKPCSSNPNSTKLPLQGGLSAGASFVPAPPPLLL